MRSNSQADVYFALPEGKAFLAGLQVSPLQVLTCCVWLSCPVPATLCLSAR